MHHLWSPAGTAGDHALKKTDEEANTGHNSQPLVVKQHCDVNNKQPTISKFFNQCIIAEKENMEGRKPVLVCPQMECQEIFLNTDGAIARHMREAHPAELDPVFVCLECQEILLPEMDDTQSDNALTRHRREAHPKEEGELSDTESWECVTTPRPSFTEEEAWMRITSVTDEFGYIAPSGTRESFRDPSVPLTGRIIGVTLVALTDGDPANKSKGGVISLKQKAAAVAGAMLRRPRNREEAEADLDSLQIPGPLMKLIRCWNHEFYPNHYAACEWLKAGECIMARGSEGLYWTNGGCQACCKEDCQACAHDSERRYERLRQCVERSFMRAAGEATDLQNEDFSRSMAKLI